MDNHLLHKLDYIEANLGDVLSMLSNYLRLNLSTMLLTIIRNVHLLKNDIIEDKVSIDIRQIVIIEKYIEDIKQTHKFVDKDILRTGHKIACQLFKISPLVLQIINEYPENSDYQRFLYALNDYCITIARLINLELQNEEIYY